MVIFGTWITDVTFGTPVALRYTRIGSVFSRQGIIPSDFCTFDALWYTRRLVHRLVRYTSWYTKWFSGTLGSLLVIVGTFGTVFGTPVAFD